MILDAHCHLGRDCVYDFEVTEELLLRTFSENGIDGGIVQPCIPRPYLADAREAHDRIRRLCLAHPGRFWGMASLSPHYTPEDYYEEVRRCVRELGFVGVKLTPNGHAVDLMSRDARTVYETARSLGIPVMVHTGMGIPFADPARLYPLVRDFPGVKTVIAHAGSDFFTVQAMQLAKAFDHVWLEPSGVGIEGIEGFLAELPPDKLMFSTDVPVQAAGELLKYRRAVKSGAALEQIFSKTAIQVFGLSPDGKQ
ncbi:amidohydrolase family protein [uncultured Anaerotruncus sp.]|uniref:amidohydrolase family protein n=1 Tax=uncultured Anaerotruncus sp. TaxID=905011 RepID=UPI002586C363|nr:amidohydrolase family protein [uncultured Anaerotruncus sp.]